MGVTQVLVWFSVLCAVAAVLAGLCAPKAWVWDWADAVYYPIAIVGVVLLFVSTERSRSVDALRREVEQAKRNITAHENTKPEFNAHNFQPVFLETSYGLLMSEVGLGDACAKVLLETSIRCITARDHARIVHKLFDGFSIPKAPAEDTRTAESIREFCERGYRLIDALQADVLIGNFVYAALKASFAELARRNLSPMDLGATDQAQQVFDAAEAKEAESILGVASGDSRKELTDYYENERKFATNVFWSFSMCLRIPGADTQNLDRFQRWATEGDRAAADLHTIQGNLEKLQNSPAQLSNAEKLIKFILDNLWPFILILALSLKFARGIANLRK
jgi:hypothetical protein